MSAAIRELSDALQNEFGLSPVMGAEVECYVLLANDSQGEMDAFWGPVQEALKADGVSLLRIEKERGDQQYEVITHIANPETQAAWLAAIKRRVAEQADKQALRWNFRAKPFEDQPSNGLHLHLHLANGDGANAYHKTEAWTSDALRWSLGGLLAKLPEHMAVFCPNEDSPYRYDDADHVPKVAGWGVNNRYCALRIPMENDPYHKRIEHRVPGADADGAQAIAAMLEGVLYGLREHIEPPEQEYGKPTVGLLKSLAPAAVGKLAHES